MTFSKISALYPALEYLFGCFFQRYWQTVQVTPDRVLREFARKKPNAIEQTIRELSIFINQLNQDPCGEDSAREFLETIDCPYYPPFYGQRALIWLRQVRAGLFCEDMGVPMEAPANAAQIPELSWYRPLCFYNSLDFPEWPLNFPNVFLGSYLPLGFPLALIEASQPLAKVPSELAGYLGQLAEVITLSRHLIPLQEVRH